MATTILRKQPKVTIPPNFETYLTVRETAERYRVSEAAIRLHLTNGTLRRYKFQGRTLIRLSDAEAMVTG